MLCLRHLVQNSYLSSCSPGQLLRLTRGGVGFRREAASGRFGVEGIPLVIELFQAEARGIKPADRFRLQEFKQARACVNGGLLWAHVTNGPDELDLPGSVSIQESSPKAPLRFFPKPGE